VVSSANVRHQGALSTADNEIPQAEVLRRRTVEFPERCISYLVVGCKPEDWERCALEVREAVSLHSQGAEPRRLEIRLPAA
jgi:hypothetical protein